MEKKPKNCYLISRPNGSDRVCAFGFALCVPGDFFYVDHPGAAKAFKTVGWNAWRVKPPKNAKIINAEDEKYLHRFTLRGFWSSGHDKTDISFTALEDRTIQALNDFKGQLQREVETVAFLAAKSASDESVQNMTDYVANAITAAIKRGRGKK